MAFLVLTVGKKAGKLYSVQGDCCVIGRQPDSDIYDPFSGDERVSRHHARVVRQAGEYYVEDAGSRNGTLLNDRLLTGKSALLEGDRVGICGVELKFYHDTPSNAPVARVSLVERPASGAVMVDTPGPSHVISSIKVSTWRGAANNDLPSHADRRLRGLLEMLGSLGTSLDVDTMLHNLLDGLFKIFVGADWGFVGLIHGENGEVVPAAVRDRYHGDGEKTIRISRTIVKQVLNSGEAVLSADAVGDRRFSNIQSIQESDIHSLLCAPLIDPTGETLGVIQIDSTSAGHQFGAEDLEVLAAIAPQAAASLRFSQLHAESLRRQAFDRDLEIARKVQHGLLPHNTPTIGHYAFFSFYEAAFQVGGDYYDYVALPGGRLAVVVADASGKGVSAALLMAKIAGELKYCLSSEETAAKAITRLNRDMTCDRLDGRFVTMVVAVIDLATHEIEIVNAGHMAPLWKTGGVVTEAGPEVRDMAVGILDDRQYRSHRIRLAPGESLVMFSDGFTEAMNGADVLYGGERLRSIVAAAAPDANLGQLIVADVEAFAGGQAQADDMCLVCVRRN